MIKAVIWDNDGVVNHSPGYYSDKLIENHNLDRAEVEKFFKDTFVPHCMSGKADLKEELHKLFPVWGVEGTVEDILLDWFTHEDCKDTEIILLITALREKGIKQYMGTNNEIYRTQYLRNEMGFNELFDAVFSAGELQVKKPDIGFYEAIDVALKKEGIKRNEVLYIDDCEKNIAAGEAFGFACHLFENRDKLLARMRELGLK